MIFDTIIGNHISNFKARATDGLLLCEVPSGEKV